MRIKGADGHDYNVTGQGQGTYNTVGASLGIASFLGLNSGNALGGLLGGNGWNNGNACNMPVSRYEAGMMQEIANKDGKIALLEANIYTDQKIADVYERLNVKINANKEAQDAVNVQQAVLNATQTATIACMKGQIEQLASLSELVVPQRRVVDTCCGNQ
jgi:hypothetical protein